MTSIPSTLAGRPLALVVLALVTLASAAMLAAAFAFQYLGDLDPCVLCVYQRWPHAAAIAIGAPTLAVAGRPGAIKPRVLMTALIAMAAALMVSAGIGVYHVGVEQGWVEASAACTGSIATMADSVETLRRQILTASTARCDEPAWVFLDISMAGWNALLAAVLAAVAVVGAAVHPRGARDRTQAQAPSGESR